MADADFLIIGGGIAGLSAGARLARHGRVVVIEGEPAIGYHSSGRSVSFSHYGIGNAAVRALTAYSRSFFEAPPEGFSETPLALPFPTLYFARLEDRASLHRLEADMAPFTRDIRSVGAAEMAELFPALRTGQGEAERGLFDPTGLKLDAHALLQSFARAIRAGGGTILTDRRIRRIERTGDGWSVTDQDGETRTSPILVNAAGAWADRIAGMAGVRPLPLAPRRRTIIVVEPPPGTNIRSWPFAHSVAGDFYILPEAGQLLVSPVDEVPDDPCDAQPEEYDVALAIDRLEHHTTLTAPRLAGRWAGLRSFAPDRTPTAGFAPDAPGFFWLGGQGGYGFQTAPAMAEAVEALVTGGAWPRGLAELGVLPHHIGVERLRNA